MMNIQIFPIKRLNQMPEGEIKGGKGILSSASKINEGKLVGISYIFRQYEDLDYECPGRSFSASDAMAFADFIKALDGKEKLFCCCDAGESRSPAVAAAVMRYFGMDDMTIWRNPHYHPNMLVYSMLTEALGVTVSDEEKDLRFYTNQKAFQDAIGRK